MNDMQRIGKFVIFFAFVANTCRAKIAVRVTEPLPPTLVEATVQMLTSCYGNRVTPVGLAGKLALPISKALESRDLSPVTLLDDTSRVVSHGPINRETRYKLQVFVITASSSGSLIKTLDRIKTSIWWNHLAAFLIIPWPTLTDDCSKSPEMLGYAWTTNILNAKVLCLHRTQGRLLYTFNPYTNRAPRPWQLVRTYTGIKHHPWTVFVRGYEDDRKICEQLDFDKTLDLGGYEIRVAVGDVVHRGRATSGGMCFDPIASDTCSIIIPALNATLKLFPHHFADSLGHMDDQGRGYGILAEVGRGTFDMGFNGRSYAVTGNLTTSVPYWQVHMHVMSQYSGYKTQWEKICSVIDGDSRIGLYIVILITIPFLRYFVRGSLTNAMLDTLRMICNSFLPIIPDGLAPRIYLTSLFIFTVTMQGIFQGRLASLLTKPEPLRNVNTMKDLAELGHKVYGVPGYRIYFGDPAFEGRFHPIKGELCTRYAETDPKAACAVQERIANVEAAKVKLHLSPRKLANNFVVLPLRPDWPLEERLNNLLRRSVSGGLKRHLNNRATYRARQLIRVQEAAYRNEGVKVLTLEQLGFAFVILGVGLGLAAVSFVIEIALGWKCLRIARVANRFHHRNE